MQARLEARRVIEQAKGLMMKSDGITEDEAYKKIREQSMNDRTSMKEVAEAIIAAQGV